MRVVYKTRVENYLNGEGIDYYTCSNWNYGELPQEKVWKEFTTFEEFYKEYGFENKTFFKHEPYVAVGVLTHEVVFGKIKKADFVDYKIVNTYKEVQYNYTMEDLMKNLKASDFIEYCKDNGLNVCPIMKE